MNGDPSKRTGNVFTISGPPSTFDGERKIGGTDLVGKYNGVFGSRFLVQGMVARHEETDKFAGAGRDIPNFIDQTVVPTATSGGFGFFQDQDFNRNVVQGNITMYLGGHDIKAGGDYEHINAINNNYNGGAGQRIYKLSTLPGGQGTVYYRHRFYVNDRAPGFVRADPSTWTIALPLTSEPDSANTSFFAQDSWKVGNYFTINGGIRWEAQDVRNRDGQSAFKLDQNWAPRVGFIWDVTKDSRSKVYANWGRFYESIPMDINIRAFGGELQCFCYNFDPSASNTIPDPSAPARSSLLGSSVEPVDPNLKGQYIDEFLGGFEYQFKSNIVVGAEVHAQESRPRHRRFPDSRSGGILHRQPGDGAGNGHGLLRLRPYRAGAAAEARGRRVRNDGAEAAEPQLAVPRQRSLQQARRELRRHVPGFYRPARSEHQLGVRLRRLPGECARAVEQRPQRAAEVPRHLRGPEWAGQQGCSSASARTGTPARRSTPTAIPPPTATGSTTWCRVARSDDGPSDWEADLHVSYPLRFGGTRRLDMIADIFNLFDRQAINAFDERYNLVSDGTCGGIPDGLCNGDGGIVTTGNSLTPAGVISNPRATATNPDYLKTGPDSQTRGFTGQRSLRLGVRFTF